MASNTNLCRPALNPADPLLQNVANLADVLSKQLQEWAPLIWKHPEPAMIAVIARMKRDPASLSRHLSHSPGQFGPMRGFKCLCFESPARVISRRKARLLGKAMARHFSLIIEMGQRAGGQTPAAPPQASAGPPASA